MGRPRKENNASPAPAKPVSISDMLKAEEAENAERARAEIERTRAERIAQEQADKERAERIAREDRERTEREAEEAARLAEEEAKRKAEREAAARLARVKIAENDYILLTAARAALDKVKACGRYANLFDYPISNGVEFVGYLNYYIGEAKRVCLAS